MTDSIDGRTHQVPQQYQVPVSRPPRDWDRIVLVAATTATALVVVAAVAWSTASIGDLLALAVPRPVAYGAASVFDLAWIGCMAIEWLARYDRDRAYPAHIAGNIALLVSMAAVGTHGWLTVNPAAGETKFTADYDEFLRFKQELKANS